MDAAVGLVQAYLRLNGYFTETEYPVVTLDGKNAVTLTDVDVLAIRFPRAGRWIPTKRAMIPCDPALNAASDRMDMIIGEVKERHNRLNRAAYTLPVVETVLRRFGCCEDPHATAEAVLRGERHCAHADHSHCSIRIVVFSGERPEEKSTRFESMSLRHAAHFIAQHLSEQKQMLLHTAHKDETIGLISLLTKLGIEM